MDITETAGIYCPSLNIPDWGDSKESTTMVDLESRSGPLQVINASLMDSLYIRMCDWETRGVDLLTSLGLPASSARTCFLAISLHWKSWFIACCLWWPFLLFNYTSWTTDDLPRPHNLDKLQELSWNFLSGHRMHCKLNVNGMSCLPIPGFQPHPQPTRSTSESPAALSRCRR